MARAIPLSTELALLASCALDADDALPARVAEAQRMGIDWDRFERLAIDHSVAGMVGERLAAIEPGALPALLAARLHRVVQQQAGIQLIQTAETVRLCKLLADAGLRSIVIKGVALAHMLYPEQPAWRTSSDIDLLIDPDTLFDADRLLRDAGYVRIAPDDEPPTEGAGRDMFLHLDNAFNYVHPDYGQLVELHYRLTLNPHWIPFTFDQLHESSTLVNTECGPVRGLDGPINFAYLCWHALAHYSYFLIWFCDISRALARAGETSCAAWVTRTQPEISPNPCIVADKLLALFRTGADTASNRRWDREAHRIVHSMEDMELCPTDRSLARMPRELANLRFMMGLGHNAPTKAYELLRTACDPRDVYALGLGRAYAPLYGALGPLLSARRYFSRGAS